MIQRSRTDLTLLLDRSGSMASIRSDVEGGLARFLAEQKALPGECDLTLVQFDSEAIETVFEARPVQRAPRIRLEPRGWTPLLDAVGRTIERTGRRLARIPEPARPGRVLFVIVTDGLENASREFTRAKVKAMIDRQQQVYSWQFIYLGANVDAFAEAAGLGIPAESAAGYHASPAGVQAAFAVMSRRCASVRDGGSSAFTVADRRELESGGQAGRG